MYKRKYVYKMVTFNLTPEEDKKFRQLAEYGKTKRSILFRGMIHYLFNHPQFVEEFKRQVDSSGAPIYLSNEKIEVN